MNSKAEFFVKTATSVRHCSRAELISAVKEGQFRPEDMISKAAIGPWVSLANVKGLKFRSTSSGKPASGEARRQVNSEFGSEVATKCSCGTVVRASALNLGKQVKCTHCNKDLTLAPQVPHSPSDAAPASNAISPKSKCSCGKSSFVSKKLAGKRLKCPFCQDWFVVTAEPTSAVPNPNELPGILQGNATLNLINSTSTCSADGPLAWLESGLAESELLERFPASMPPLPELPDPQSFWANRPTASVTLNKPLRVLTNKRTAVYVVATILLALFASIAVVNRLRNTTDLANAGSTSTVQDAANSHAKQAIPSVLRNSVKNLGRTLSLNQAERSALAEKIRQIEHKLALAEIGADTVYQQQSARLEACIEMTGTLANSLGASSAEVQLIVLQSRTLELSADTVFQQIAVRVSAHSAMLKLACEKAGASSAAIGSTERTSELNDSLADTAQQQIAARTSGVLEMSQLLASTIGAEESRLASIATSVALNDSLSDTVFQQMSARQMGIVKMLAAAAIASGAEIQVTSSIESQMSSDDILAETAQQQFAARIQRTFEMTRLIAQANVLK